MFVFIIDDTLRLKTIKVYELAFEMSKCMLFLFGVAYAIDSF
jgi:hypothetical protein